jgi:hypothetical protein
MVLRLDGQLNIDNFRHYPELLVSELREQLAAGALVQLDPHRDNFYEVEASRHVFYIHVSPQTGKVLLLGVWEKAPGPMAEAGRQARHLEVN